MTQLIIAEADRIRGLIDRMESFGDTARFTRNAVNIHEVLGPGAQGRGNQLCARRYHIGEFRSSLPAVLG
jgi:two-component system nitrogen regulation sensor histidine kinase GlnL